MKFVSYVFWKVFLTNYVFLSYVFPTMPVSIVHLMLLNIISLSKRRFVGFRSTCMISFITLWGNFAILIIFSSFCFLSTRHVVFIWNIIVFRVLYHRVVNLHLSWHIRVTKQPVCFSLLSHSLKMVFNNAIDFYLKTPHTSKKNYLKQNSYTFFFFFFF